MSDSGSPLRVALRFSCCGVKNQRVRSLSSKSNVARVFCLSSRLARNLSAADAIVSAGLSSSRAT
jgi:hypothetical protein